MWKYDTQNSCTGIRSKARVCNKYATKYYHSAKQGTVENSNLLPILFFENPEHSRSRIEKKIVALVTDCVLCSGPHQRIDPLKNEVRKLIERPRDL